MDGGGPSEIGHRSRLDRDMIIEAALQLVRTEGISAVTMRRIADQLGSAPMSLYRHVADRQQVLVGMLDAVATGIEHPPPQDDARAEITVVVTAMHDALRQDPWVVQVLATTNLASTRVLPLMDRVLSAMRGHGLCAKDAVSAFHLLWHYVFGEVLMQLHDKPGVYARRIACAVDAEAHPTVAEVLREVPPAAPRDYFAVNLQRLLDGVLGG